MSEIWELLTFLWESVYGFLNTSIITIGSVDISLWELALGFTLFGMMLSFIVRIFWER